MTDREKIIKAWEIFRSSNPYEICDGREFQAIKEPEYCMGQMVEDTIALLKEQEPKHGHWIDEGYVPSHTKYTCSECGWSMLTNFEYIRKHRFCLSCGADMRDENGKTIVVEAMKHDRKRMDIPGDTRQEVSDAGAC